MLVLHQFIYVLFTLRGTFMHFLELTYKPVSNYTMRPVRKKPYQEKTLNLHIPLELDDDNVDRNKMEHIS